MELNTYCWKICKDTLLYSYYAVVDEQFSLSCFLCMKYRIKAKYYHRYDKPGTDYSIYLVRVWRKDQFAFEHAMSEFPEVMRKAKHYGYEAFCKELHKELEKENIKRFAEY